MSLAPLRGCQLYPKQINEIGDKDNESEAFQ
ncbi:hypothetical protein W822_02745 [Advenella kashmirensis W13003]|uniref:Uncharacterized protein n=1 Tax=Advenella kashmirensis W13003 TaxID=1424334 RepID=V8QZ72_9BURK|nr:hypothetical protein W822_02745 [Advenella kashmirensis W13003]